VRCGFDCKSDGGERAPDRGNKARWFH
jgi:hypothetical protein